MGKFEVGNTVKLPFEEEGIITRIETRQLDWFPIKVAITKSNDFNELDTVVEFKEDQLELYN
jgi:hypothetical protein